MQRDNQTEARQEWQQPVVSELGSVEDMTNLKFAGGYDGVEIQLSNGDIITGS